MTRSPFREPQRVTRGTPESLRLEHTEPLTAQATASKHSLAAAIPANRIHAGNDPHATS